MAVSESTTNRRSSPNGEDTPVKWSWLQGPPHSRSIMSNNGSIPLATHNVFRSRRIGGLNIGCITLLVSIFIIMWISATIFYFYLFRLTSKEEINTFHPFNFLNIHSTKTQTGLTGLFDLSTLLINQMKDTTVLESLPLRTRSKGPVRGGSVAIKRTLSAIVYPGASMSQMHGIVGLGPNQVPLWKKKKKPTIPNIKEALRLGGGFNIDVSDTLSLDRDVIDQRHKECKEITYNLNELPEASVIIVFHDEPFSTLMRSVHSVLNRTPPTLLKEIILVDDSSTKDHLYSNDPNKPSLLQYYIKFLPKTRLLRTPEWSGIVGARLLGIENALADIFVILDSHIEVQPQWIEPLLFRIQQNRRYIVMPQVDGIGAGTLEFSNGGIGCTLGFIWKLMEHSFTPDNRNPNRKKKKITDFIESPTMAGGLFAAHTQFFLDIGGYDRGMTYWGAENIEFSFRLWQCGGILECSQCSRVYHIFRSGGSGYSVPDHNSLTRNKLRLMSVWMDEFADLPWRVLGKPVIPIGDISSRIELRTELQCKPFSYFLNTVWPESDVKNLTQDVPYLGRLRIIGTDKCLSIRSPNPLEKAIIVDCTKAQDMMYFRETGRIMPVKNDEACLNKKGEFQWCTQYEMNEARWKIFELPGPIILEPSEKNYEQHIQFSSHSKPALLKKALCLSVQNITEKLIISPCKTENHSDNMLRRPIVDTKDFSFQMWDWERYNPPETWSLLSNK